MHMDFARNSFPHQEAGVANGARATLAPMIRTDFAPLRRVVRTAGLGLLVAALGFSAACRSAEKSTAQPLEAALCKQIDQLVREQAQRQQLVAVSVAIARADGLVHVTHFGLQDREQNIAANDATLYRWASISKPLTAVVALQLTREGALDLDRDVRSYVPEFPEQAWPITSRQLLCHQGGIVHYSNGVVLGTPPRPWIAHPYEDAVDALAKFAASPLIAQPGTRYSYTTHGYVLLGAVVQRAGRENFEHAVLRRIAKPAGMSTIAADKSWVQLPNRAAGYRKNSGGEIVASNEVDVSWKLAGGGFISNVLDLGRFGSGMLACTLIDRDNRELMWTAQSTLNGAATSYGLGFGVADYNGERLIQHSGSQEKTRTRLLLLPEQDLAVAIMTNSEWADLAPLGTQLLDALTQTP
jgi:CubicO group peptidase (beta-lactamase class C family)